MWKLFQSVLKSFKTQAVVPPCNRISAATPDQSASLSSGTGSEEDDNTGDVCGSALKPQPQIEAPLRRAETFVTFPQIEQPSPVKNAFSLSHEKPAKSVKFNVPFKPVEIHSSRSPHASVLSTETPREECAKPSMASLHDAMGLASLKGRDKETALQHFLIAADVFGSSRANYNLGVLYEFHLNNVTEAARRYRLAGSHPDALYNLAYLTLNGPDASALIPRREREKEALLLLKKAAKFGSKEAANFLTNFYKQSNRPADTSAQLDAELCGEASSSAIPPPPSSTATMATTTTHLMPAT